MKIWHVVDGPYQVDHSDIHWLVCLIEVTEGKLETTELYYPSFDDAYEVKKYFDKNIEPLEYNRDDSILND